MDRDELVNRYFEAWNRRDAAALLRMMHPQASYYDAYWQESCSGRHLAKYFSTSFETDARWYKPRAELIAIPNGVIARYDAFERDDADGKESVYNGAEIITISDGLIMTISDYYCDPTPTELMEVAELAEGQHGRANVIRRGLGAQSAGRIKRRLGEATANPAIILDPAITVTKLADHIDCEVMHLFHVLEELQDTTFLEFVNESRARHASTMMIDSADGQVSLDEIAAKCGFSSIPELDEAFRSTFGESADEYLQKFAK